MNRIHAQFTIKIPRTPWQDLREEERKFIYKVGRALNHTGARDLSKRLKNVYTERVKVHDEIASFYRNTLQQLKKDSPILGWQKHRNLHHYWYGIDISTYDGRGVKVEDDLASVLCGTLGIGHSPDLSDNFRKRFAKELITYLDGREFMPLDQQIRNDLLHAVGMVKHARIRRGEIDENGMNNNSYRFSAADREWRDRECKRERKRL